MAVVQNCTVCLEPLSGSSLPQIIAGSYTFPCTHKIHRTCLVRWTDTMHVEQPEKKTLNCPECRKVTPIPTKHSAEQISEWIKIAPKFLIATRTFFGVAIGAGLSRSPRGSEARTKLEKAVTEFYNQVHETSIQPRDVWIYQSGFSSTLPRDTQLAYVQDYLMQTEIGTFVVELEDTPFDAEERKSLEAHTAVLIDLQANDRSLAILFFAGLELTQGDIFAKIKRINVQLLQSTGNTELKEQLGDMIQDWLKNLIIRLDMIPLDSRMSTRITLIKTLEHFKEKFEFESPQKGQQWLTLLSTLQNECRQPTSSLIRDLQARMEPGFFDQPLTLLLWDDVLADDVFDALYQLRKQQFKQAGFVLEAQ